jgi:hypothetical protein
MKLGKVLHTLSRRADYLRALLANENPEVMRLGYARAELAALEEALELVRRERQRLVNERREKVSQLLAAKAP